MKKLLLLLLIAFSFSVNAQNAYYDALMLNSKKDSIKIVYDSLSSPKYQGFYELDKIIQFVKEKKIYSQDEFTKIYKFSNKENLFLKDLPQLNSIKLQNQFVAFKIYLKIKNKQDSILKANSVALQSHRNEINKIWSDTQTAIEVLFKSDTNNCYYKINTPVISVKSQEKANNNKDNVLFFFKPQINIPIPTIPPSFKSSLVIAKDSLYFYLDNSAIKDCDENATNNKKLAILLNEKNKIINTANIQIAAILKSLRISYDEVNDILRKNGIPLINVTESANKSLDGSSVSKSSEESISAKQKTSSPIITGVSFDPTTRIIDATAQWLVKRTKEELTMSFYDKFREKLDSEDDIRLMLPATYTMLQNQENVYQIPTLGKVWASAFVSDIKQIPFNFEALVNQKYPDIAQKDDFLLFMITAHSFDMLGRGSHPADIFDFLNDTYGGNKKANEKSIITQTIRLVDLLSKNLRDTATIKIDKIKKDTTLNENAWITKDKLAKLKDPTIRKFYLGLLYQQDSQLFDDIQIKKTDGTDQSIKAYFTANNNFQYIDKSLTQVLQFLNNVDAQLKVLKASGIEKQKQVNFVQYAQMVFDVVDIGFRVKYLMTEPNPDNSYYTSEYFKTWRPIGVNAIEGIKAFYGRNYGAGFMHSVQVIRPIWQKVGKTNANIEKIGDAFEIISGFNKAKLNNEKTIANTNIRQLNADIIAINGGSSFGKAEIHQLRTKYEDLKNTNKELTNIKGKFEIYEQNLIYLDSYFLLSNGGAFKDIEDKIQQKRQEILDNRVPANTTILNDALKVLVKKQEELCKIFINKNKDATDDSDKKKIVLDQFAFYANFITDIITADSTTNLTEIINRYAQPVGSYSIKRKNYWSIDVNAYPNLFAGSESPFKSSDINLKYLDKEKNKFVMGVSAPIGISFSRGQIGKNKKASLSFFLPIVDIGAAFSYRWSDTYATTYVNAKGGKTDTTINKLGGLPKIKFSQIFAPGAYLIFGFRNVPIACMIGGQLSPKLRSIDISIPDTNNTNAEVVAKTIDYDMWRFSAGISVDISIFNLYHRKNKNL